MQKKVGLGMEMQIAEWVVQSGTAGLIAWMWLTERRHGRDRDEKLNEAHQRIMSDVRQIDQLVRTVEQNAKAATALELTQRRLVDVLETMWGLRRAADRGRGPPNTDPSNREQAQPGETRLRRSS